MDDKIYIALNSNVFVKEVKQEMKQGSMLLPDSLDNDFIFGEVISVAEGFYNQNGMYIPSMIAPGDIVVFPKISGTKVNFNKIPMIRVMQQDIVAKQVNGSIEETEE